ncbi:MAG: PLP-dependent aminotransferase family protein [Arenicellales bacterium]
MNNPQPRYLHAKVADKIKHMIETSILKAGDKLPSVRVMAKEAEVSISTVLQAYANLESDRLIYAKPQSGYFVSELAVKNIDIPDRIHCSTLTPKPALAFNVWGAIYESATNDDILPLGLANPKPELLPVSGLSRSVRHVLSENPDTSVQYSFPPGELALRRQIAAQYYMRNQEVDIDDIIITSGCTEAILLSLRAVAKHGDVIAVESPVYFVLLRIVKSLGMTVIEIESDPSTGMSVDALERATASIEITAVICIPNFSNPNGTLMPDTKKKRLVALLNEKNIPLIEDDIYSELYFGEHKPSNCRDFDSTGNVLTCSSFSKTIAPGYRIGWVIPGKHREMIIQHKRLTSAATSTLPQLAIAHFLQTGAYQRHLKKMRQTFKEQLYIMRQSIARHFPKGTRISDPKGSFVLWIQLPMKIDTLVLAERAMNEKISIGPGMMFSVSNQYSNFLRLCTGYLWTDEAEQGVKRLAEIIQEMQ